MVDLSQMNLRDLRGFKPPEEMLAAISKQVERPRVNLGGDGPPGRVD